MSGFDADSREQIEAEIAEKALDLAAFQYAREVIRRRVLEVRDSSCELTPLPEWSGTDAVLGSLDLCIHAMERTLAELRALYIDAKSHPVLTVVKGGSDEEV